MQKTVINIIIIINMVLILKYLVLNKKRRNALNWKHGKVVPIDFFIAFFLEDCRVLYMTDFYL